MIKKIFIAIFILAGPAIASAHGIVQDGHEGELRLVDWIEIIGMLVLSLGLLSFSFTKCKKERNNDNQTDKGEKKPGQ
jgi:hypothetical protein